MSRIRIEEIQEELAKDGWKLISTEYKNLDSELVFECANGHQVYNSWKKIRLRRECPVCNQNQLAQVEKPSVPKKAGEFRTLALDQATKITGWAIFSNATLLQYGAFKATAANEIDRDIQIKNWLINIIENWHIDFVALEGIQYEQAHGAVVYATLARLQGILMSMLTEQGIRYTICHTATWRKFSGVKGKTRNDKKRSMQLRVKEWYGVDVSDDCADAIGIGKYAVEQKSPKPKIENWE